MVLDLLKKQAELAKGHRILDVGFAQDPNPYLTGDVTGIDVQSVEKPANYSKVLVLNLNDNEFPFPCNHFDTVILGSCIEHVENASKLLRESNRVLKKNGHLIVTVPHANDPWTTVHNWLLPFVPDQDEGEHLTNWSKKDMMRLIRKNGFAVDNVIGTSLSIPVIKLRIPVGPFPMLGWILIFDARKVRLPDERIFTRDYETKKFIKIKHNIQKSHKLTTIMGK